MALMDPDHTRVAVTPGAESRDSPYLGGAVVTGHSVLEALLLCFLSAKRLPSINEAAG